VEEFEATVTSKGQVTLPVRLRSSLGLKAGDKLVFRRDESGDIHLTARSATLGDLLGVVRTGPPNITDETVERWIEESRGRKAPGRS
jgi:antitoxin PrlF